MKVDRIPIPKTIWTLGFVSLFMDLSSELIHSLLPVFLVTTLGASALTVGMIEGMAEAAALMVRVFSGTISDFFGKRKFLIFIGYGMAALSKPLFPMAGNVETVCTARFLDRIGKGIRGAPRDALIADVSPPEIRGACFGLRQSMDTVGAFLGPLLAVLLLFLYQGDIELVLWVAVVPALLAVLLIVVGIEEPKARLRSKPARSPLSFKILNEFSGRYRWVVALGALFTMARFSEAFLVLRAAQIGLAVTWIPLAMVLMSLAYALSAYPAGLLSDRIEKRSLLALGMVFLILADLILANAETLPMLFVGLILWGFHMGFSQGILAAMVADTTPAHWKGTAYGFFNFVSGVFMLLASVLAGWLWDRYGAEFTFYCGALFASLALLMLMKRY